jgi:hypothetical protein
MISLNMQACHIINLPPHQVFMFNPDFFEETTSNSPLKPSLSPTSRATKRFAYCPLHSTPNRRNQFLWSPLPLQSSLRMFNLLPLHLLIILAPFKHFDGSAGEIYIWLSAVIQGSLCVAATGRSFDGKFNFLTRAASFYSSLEFWIHRSLYSSGILSKGVDVSYGRTVVWYKNFIMASTN